MIEKHTKIAKKLSRQERAKDDENDEMDEFDGFISRQQLQIRALRRAHKRAFNNTLKQPFMTAQRKKKKKNLMIA